MIKIVALVIVVALAGWWIASSGDSATPTPTSTESATTTSPAGTSEETGIPQPITIEISGSEFKYEPATMTAKVGQPVTVVYKNVGKYPHDFVIDELGVKSQVIKSGETDSFIFTPTKTGTFSFYCSLPNHLERGMKGTFIVN